MNTSIYQNIATRTAGDIYIGVVGPVRTGKSTFIKRFMETQVIPNIDNVYRKERARDELPQSGSGRTIMTAEPKFVPEEAAQIQLPDGASFSVRLIDCVGYMVKGAIGQMEDDTPRMVTTPWYDHEIPMTEAAEIGTRKVIAEHSTIGIVITTDGTISDIPREDYLEAEERVIRELQELGKPFIVLLNSADPRGDRAQAIAKDISSRYEVNCMAVNCLELDEDAVAAILKAVLYEFPMQELDLFLPPWVDALPADHPIKAGLYDAIRQNTAQLRHIREVEGVIAALGESEHISEARISAIDLGTGVAAARLALPRELFYKTLSEQSGFEVGDDGDLMSLLTIIKGLPLAYNKDLQEDKLPVFDAGDTLKASVNIFTEMIATMKVKEENMERAAKYGYMNATDAADYLVTKGIPFRDCHEIIGRIVLYCINKGIAIEEMSMEEFKSFSDQFDMDIYDKIAIRSCIKAKRSQGSTSFDSVKQQLADIKKAGK